LLYQKMLSFPFFNFYRFKKIKIRKKMRNFTQTIFYVKNREILYFLHVNFGFLTKNLKQFHFSEHFPT